MLTPFYLCICMYVRAQDSKAYCCGCLPELNSGLLGLRVLKESQKALNKLVSNTNGSKISLVVFSKIHTYIHRYMHTYIHTSHT